MLENNEKTIAIADAFHAAALDSSGWYPALDALAQATGSRGGELICLGKQASLPLHIMTNVDPAIDQAFLECGGGHPDINPRVGAGMRAPVLKVLAESDFITPDEHARHPHYQEFARPWDIPFICLATLDRTDDLLVGLAVVRSQKQGHITPEQRAVFASIAPHVRAAARTQMALEHNSSALLAGAMEALSIAAFICDASGRVRAMSPQAEQLVSAQRGLNLRLGRLTVDHSEESQVLQTAIEAAAAPGAKAANFIHRTVTLRGKQNEDAPMVLDVFALPRREYDLNFSPRVLVVARGTRRASERKSQILRTLYSLTSAEADIAVQVGSGRPAEAIAAVRGVSVGTVRAQLKTIMGKMGVRRQIELAARLAEICA
jgi:DNA-binding NarL/FixJ family response regulator